MPHGKIYSKADIAYLRKHAATKSISAIARHLKTTPERLYHVARRRGIDVEAPPQANARRKQVFILFTADAHHTINSRSVAGVFTTKTKAIEAVEKYLNADDLHNLLEINQTQGREENFMIEQYALNEANLT